MRVLIALLVLGVLALTGCVSSEITKEELEQSAGIYADTVEQQILEEYGEEVDIEIVELTETETGFFARAEMRQDGELLAVVCGESEGKDRERDQLEVVRCP